MNPPIPSGLILVLGVILPIVYQTFITKLPGFWKAIVSYGLSAAIAIVCSIFVLHIHNLGEVMTNIAWIWAASSSIYQILVKPMYKKLFTKTNNIPL